MATETAKIAFLFSGQGAQYPGMAAELTAHSEAAKEVFSCASQVLGYDLLDYCLNGTAEALARTEVSQPAIMATSLAALTVVQEAGISAGAVAGHSLGEYAAMVAAGMLSMTDGFALIQARAEAMRRCAAAGDGAMTAVIGLPAEEVEALCGQVSGYVEPVNYNSPVQTVVAGDRPAVEALGKLVSERGKRAIPLAVSAAFHSKRMQPAADLFLPKAQAFSFQEPTVDFYSNLLGGKRTDFSNLPEELARHIVSPVRFTDELNALWSAGYRVFVELGPGKVLTGLTKKTLKEAIAVNIEDEKTRVKALDVLC